MKNDNLKRNDAAPPVISGDFVSTQSVVAITNLSVTGPYRGDFQVIDQGRVIVGENPDTGARGILAAKALQGFNSSGINTFAVWFATTEAHAPGDFHAGNLAGNFLQYNQTDGTLGLYTPDGAGVIMDNDGTFIAGHQDHGHMKWDATSESLKIMSGREVMAEIGDAGSATFQGIITAQGGRITGRMLVEEVLQVGDTDGPAIYVGKFIRTNDTGEDVETAEIIATDPNNLPWLHVVAGGETAAGGYFHLGGTGDYSNNLSFDGERVVLSGALIWAGGKGVADETGISHTEDANTFWRVKPAADVFMEINSSGDANYKALQVEENYGIGGYFKGGYIGVYGKSTTDEIGIMGYSSLASPPPGSPPPTESGGGMTDGIEALNPGVSVYGLTEGGTAGRFVAQNSGAGGRALVAKSDDNTYMALFAWNTGTGPALVTQGSTKLGDGGTTNYAQFSATGSMTVHGSAVIVHTEKTPASATATGVKGEICFDGSYIYVCTATNVWRRAAISSW